MTPDHNTTGPALADPATTNDGWAPTSTPGTINGTALAALRDKVEKEPAVSERERSSSGQPGRQVLRPDSLRGGP